MNHNKTRMHESRRRRNLGLEIRNMNGQALKFTSLYDFQKKRDLPLQVE